MDLCKRYNYKNNQTDTGVMSYAPSRSKEDMIVIIKLSGSVDHRSDDANPFPITKNLPRSYWNVDLQIISLGI
jgi:hypothetical protein